MTSNYPNEIDVETLQRWLARGEPVEVIDIRPAQDYQEWHIPGSRNLDAYRALYARNPGPLATYEAPADTPVVTVCYVGQTSQIASHYLRSRGIRAMSLAGGMQRWSLAWNSAQIDLPGSGGSLIQVRRTGKGCLSYLLGSDGQALVVDPSVQPQVYLDLAAAQGWQIAKVLDTHIHADHLSRSRLLVEETGAVYLLPRQERVDFPYEAVDPGDEIPLGGVRLRALSTPGHTYESLSFLLEGQALFTGDTLFLDGVGRPDLKAGRDEAEARARKLFRSLRNLTALDPALLVLPSHAGKPIAFDRVPVAARLGKVAAAVDGLLGDEEAFVARILERLPPNPPNFEQVVQLNEAGKLPPIDLTILEAGANHCAA